MDPVPPFRFGEIRAAIPKHCWVKSPFRSMTYAVKDVIVVFALVVAAYRLDSWLVWSIYWAVQGTMFWALSALGHDCGHGSFSDILILNSVVGHVLHFFILVPYDGWRISHRTHHQNHGHGENDESWVLLTEKTYKSLDIGTRLLRFTGTFPFLAPPFYLWSRSLGKKGFHFNPNSDLLALTERMDVLTSTICWSIMLALLASMSFVFGLVPVLKIYGGPYLVFVMWLDIVTYLHHHGNDEKKLTWYRGKPTIRTRNIKLGYHDVIVWLILIERLIRYCLTIDTIGLLQYLSYCCSVWLAESSSTAARLLPGSYDPIIRTIGGQGIPNVGPVVVDGSEEAAHTEKDEDRVRGGSDQAQARQQPRQET